MTRMVQDDHGDVGWYYWGRNDVVGGIVVDICRTWYLSENDNSQD